MDRKELTESIRKFALEEAGFDLFGVTDPVLPSVYADAAEKWVADGFAGEMGYMSRDVRRRADAGRALPAVRSVISLAVNYFHPEDSRPDDAGGKISKYAYGADYHDVIDVKLKRLAAFVRELGGPGTETKTYVDTGPLLERAYAKEAGLGFFGKNTNVITKEFGSWVFLASLLTSLELERSKAHGGACGTCRLCLDACPTDAILSDYRLDATKCISYWTIEAKSEAPPELSARFGEWAFGCDICQDVCPYNRRGKTTKAAELYPAKRAGSWLPAESSEKLASDESFAAAFRGSPIKRPKRVGIQRNLRYTAGGVSK